MRKENSENQDMKVKQHRNMDKGQVFVKIMAGILAILMVAGTAISLIYALIQR